jgi:imidazoleglycerol phosphate dehydratase HisB
MTNRNKQIEKKIEQEQVLVDKYARMVKKEKAAIAKIQDVSGKSIHEGAEAHFKALSYALEQQSMAEAKIEAYKTLME